MILRSSFLKIIQAASAAAKGRNLFSVRLERISHIIIPGMSVSMKRSIFLPIISAPCRVFNYL